MKLSQMKDLLKVPSSQPITWEISKSFSILTSPKRLLIGISITAIMFIFTLVNVPAFNRDGVPMAPLLFVLSIAASLFAGILIAANWSIPRKLTKHINRFAILILPLMTMTMVECLNGVWIGNWASNAWVLNCIFYSLLYLTVYALSGSYKLPFLVLNPLLFILSLVNHYVTAFRGTPFLPMDFLYADTATTVAGAYNFSLNYQIVLAIELLIVIQLMAWKIITPSKTVMRKIISRTVAGVISFGILGSYYTSDFLTNAGLTPYFFKQEYSYKQTGVALNFWLNTKYLTAEKPKGYDSDAIEKIVSSVLGNTEDDKTPDNTNMPNIICIMNESLSDLKVLGDFSTNKDYMPFLSSLEENTVKGNLYVPVIGAGTSNTEFEFLTGITTAFLPVGSNAYTLYVKDQIPNLTSVLNKLGYTSRAFHPYIADNWNRPKVYNNMGFERFDGMEMFFNEKIVNAYKNGNADILTIKSWINELFPTRDDVLLRHVVSDKFNYEKVIEMYEERDPAQPFYIFNITMQNHGGYKIQNADFEEEIYLTDEDGNSITTYPKTNEYLSLIYESDKAFEELINYFKEQEEPTIICMFGDHQPNIENEFIAEISGVETIYDLNLIQTQSRYVTPFYIWANYDIEEKEIDKLSINYLSSYLMDIANVEMPLLNKYLLKLSETIPVINTVGYIDSQDQYYLYTQKTKYDELIKGYKYICYNYLFDKNNRCDWLFEIQEKD